MLRKTRAPAGAIRAAGFLSVSALALTSGQAFAQDGEAQDAESEARNDNVIIVTARTFEEDLQDVPLTVSALTAEDLDRQPLFLQPSGQRHLCSR